MEITGNQDLALAPSAKGSTIVVVGGVAGGMSCAARARRLDESARVIVLERGQEVSYANCGLPHFVGGEITDPGALLVQTRESLGQSLNLDVRTGHNVTGFNPAIRTVTVENQNGTEEIRYDSLVLSPGATAIRPPIAGLDSPRVHTLRTVTDAHALHALATGPARNAVVLGAGFIGIEAAEALHLQGLNVTIIELAPHVLPALEPEVAHSVTTELRRLGIEVRAGVSADEIRVGDGSDVVALSDGTEVPADFIVLSVGVRPDTAPFESSGIECERGAIITDEYGRTSVPNVWAAGDATLSTDALTGLRRPVALAGPANRAGRLVADNILLPDSRPIPSPIGTSIVRAGGLTAAMTGANRAALQACGIAHHTIDLHPLDHAGYFPGASTMHLVVHFRADDGLLLGAQAVGEGGIDKRIDVLATAIRAGLGVEDLIDLDLAYSPPYGQAKDAVNLAGFIGANIRSGMIKLWSARNLTDARSSALILDVRSSQEHAEGHVPDSLNIPHTKLRDRLDEVRDAADGRPVRLICRSGVRSYLAHRILTQSGFDSATLSGGMLSLRAVLGDAADDLLQVTDSVLFNY